VGLKRLRPGLFAGIAWSSGSVFPSTLRRFRKRRMRTRVLPFHSDIDTPADLEKYFSRKNGG
jgi:glycosyltransferase A (GT-A) superfamily protein (DUF2064 family)